MIIMGELGSLSCDLDRIVQIHLGPRNSRVPFPEIPGRPLGLRPPHRGLCGALFYATGALFPDKTEFTRRSPLHISLKCLFSNLLSSTE